MVKPHCKISDFVDFCNLFPSGKAVKYLRKKRMRALSSTYFSYLTLIWGLYTQYFDIDICFMF